MDGDYQKPDLDQVIVLSNINKIKEQDFKIRKKQSVMLVIPGGWIKDNFKNSKGGKLSVHRISVHGEDVLAIRRVK